MIKTSCPGNGSALHSWMYHTATHSVSVNWNVPTSKEHQYFPLKIILLWLYSAPCPSLHVLYVVLNMKPVRVLGALLGWFPVGRTAFSIKMLIKGHLTFGVARNKVLKPRGVSSAPREGQNIILQSGHTARFSFNCDLEGEKNRIRSLNSNIVK